MGPSPNIVRIFVNISTRDEAKQEAEVEVVHLAHDLLPPLRRRRGLVVAARGRRDRELEAEPDEADHQPEHEAPEGAGFVGTRPEDGEQVDRAYGRGEVRGDGLDVVKQLRALAGLHQSEVSTV